VRILFHDLAGEEFEHDGKKYYDIKEHDVVAIIKKNLSIE